MNSRTTESRSTAIERVTHAPGVAAQLSGHAFVHRAGVTMIEVLLVLVLLSAATAVSMPRLSEWQRSMALTTSADKFERVHELTRVTAVREGRIAELHIDPSGRRFWVEVDTTDGGVRDTVAMVTELAEEVSFTSDRTLLCFDGRGLPTTVNGCESPDATVAFTSAASGEVESTTITLLGKVMR